MTITAELYQQNGTTKIRDLTLGSQLRFKVGERQHGEGGITIPVNTTEATDLLDNDPRIVRFLLDGTPMFDGYVTKANRVLSDEGGGLVTVTMPGTRYGIIASQIYPREPSCHPIDNPTSRLLGPTDALYDPTVHPGVQSYGIWEDQQSFFPPLSDGTLRAPEFPDGSAQFITHGLAEQPPGEAWFFSPTFTVTASGDYGLAIAADDEYDVWLLGSLVGSTRGEFSWKVTDLHILRLCTGINYRLVIRVNNLDRTIPTGNPNSYIWTIASVIWLSNDGTPIAQNQIYHMYVSATGGVYTLSVNGATTGGIAYNASAATVQTALEALSTVGTGNVTTSGTGAYFTNHQVSIENDATAGQFVLVVNGLQTNLMDYNASAVTVKARIEELAGIDTVTVTGIGTNADPWIVTFDGAAVQGQSHTVTDTDGPGFNGTTTINTIATGNDGDPMIIEFTGIKANTPMLMSFNGSGLSGDSVEGGVIEVQSGSSNNYVIHTNLDWFVLAYPASPPGLNAGQMLSTLITEMINRGVSVYNQFTQDYTTSLDSNNTAYTTEFALPVTPYATGVMDVVEFLEQYDLAIWMDVGWVLKIEQGRGTDLSGTVNISNARLSADSSFSLDKEIANVLLSQTADGEWVETKSNPSITDHGRWEQPYTAPEGMASVVEFWQDAALEDSIAPYREYTVGLAPETGDDMPFADFDWGDDVTGPTITGGSGLVHVSAIEAFSIDENNAHEFRVTLVEQ